MSSFVATKLDIEVREDGRVAASIVHYVTTAIAGQFWLIN
jgi:hypothetical protein